MVAVAIKRVAGAIVAAVLAVAVDHHTKIAPHVDNPQIDDSHVEEKNTTKFSGCSTRC